ncbi:MAG: pitrilysin family protein [Ignavibacteriales bacterium]|nr:pitrilysin family protein [Ignavibacteriales bacterium]
MNGYEFVAEYPLVGSLRAQRFRMANGLSVAVVEDHTTPIFAYQTWYKVGSADEPAGRQGLAHLFEHMMFRKTSRRNTGVFDQEVNFSGGSDLNAYTARDQTVYHFTFPVEKLELAADLEADRMQNLIIDEETFEIEKGAVLAEKNRTLDDPMRALWDVLYKEAYTTHNYRYTTIGDIETIKSFTVQEAEEFYRRYYAPNNALVIVVGDVWAEEVMSIIGEKYGNIPLAPTPSRLSMQEPPQKEDRSITITHPKAVKPISARLWHVPSVEHPDYPALAVLGRILTSGKSAILRERLVYSAKVTELVADAFNSRDSGMFEFLVQLVDGIPYDDVQNIFFAAVEELALGRISDDQMQVVKNNLQRGLYQSILSQSNLARNLGEGYIMADNLAMQFSFMKRTEHTTVADIRRVARQYILDAKSTLGHVLPEEGART